MSTQQTPEGGAVHTPGPWRVVIDGTCSGAWPFIGPAHLPDDELRDEAIAELGTTHAERARIRMRGMPGTFAEKPQRFEPTPEHDTIMANACLIAAAPDSHEANVLMVDALNVAFHIAPDYDDERIEDEMPTSAVAAAYFAARSAIAKATGAQP